MLCIILSYYFFTHPCCQQTMLIMIVKFTSKILLIYFTGENNGCAWHKWTFGTCGGRKGLLHIIYKVSTWTFSTSASSGAAFGTSAPVGWTSAINVFTCSLRHKLFEVYLIIIIYLVICPSTVNPLHFRKLCRVRHRSRCHSAKYNLGNKIKCYL